VQNQHVRNTPCTDTYRFLLYKYFDELHDMNERTPLEDCVFKRLRLDAACAFSAGATTE
jgi:hypothetical protein